MPSRARLRRVPPPPVSETHARVTPSSVPPPSDPDAEALLFVAKMMGRARVAQGVAKIAAGLVAGVASRATADLLESRYARVLHVARAAANAATHVATQRAQAVAAQVAAAQADEGDETDDDVQKSCVDVA